MAMDGRYNRDYKEEVAIMYNYVTTRMQSLADTPWAFTYIAARYLIRMRK